jgi:hypothetical protein
MGNEPLRCRRTLFWQTSGPRFKMADFKASAAAEVATAVCVTRDDTASA